MLRSLWTVITPAVTATLALVAAPATAHGGEMPAFDRLHGHYEVVRQALLHDTTTGVAEAAASIERELDALGAEFSESAAGVRAGAVPELRDLLPAIRTAASDLQASGTIEEARESFGALSEAMVRYRQLVADPAPVVAFCSMAQAVWLQPPGEIGNPYYGQSMARCGEIVSQ